MIAKRYGLMTVGAFLMAFSVVVYFNPLELVTGGVTGLAILLEHLFHIPLWLVNAAVNIPLFIIGYKVLGKLIFYRTVYATVCLSVFLGLIRPLPLLTGDVLVDGLCGGVKLVHHVRREGGEVCNRIRIIQRNVARCIVLHVRFAHIAACGGELFIVGIAVPHFIEHIQRVSRGFGRALPVSVRGAANHAKREYNGQYGRNCLFHKHMSPFVPCKKAYTLL